jgi:putative addiction module CopG family antidote
LTPELERFVDAKVESGLYNNASEVVREGLRLLKEQDEIQVRWREQIDWEVPPGNRLHALGADLRGFHAVRVNDQYRIVFRLESGDAFDVQCTDYH